MKFCVNCGKPLIEGARFCAECGAAVPSVETPVAEQPIIEQPIAEQPVIEQPVIEQPAPEPTAEPIIDVPVMYDDGIAQEKEVLDSYYRLFKAERIAWKIYGIVMLVISLFFIGCGMLAVFASILNLEYIDSGYGVAASAGTATAIVLFVFYMVYGIMFLPVAIVNLKMVKRAEYYMDTVYTDVRPTITRCSSIGMFILAGFFNEIALIFIIINFVRTKTNKDMLARIEQRQQNFRG